MASRRRPRPANLACRAVTFVVAVLGLVASLAEVAAQGIDTKAPQAILVEHESGSVLYEKNADQPAAPASLAKLMTIAVLFDLLKEGKLTLNQEFPVSENAWRKGGAASGGSTMFLVLNSRVRIEDLIRGIIIQSGNDASIAVAEGIAGTEEAFARVMNDKARQIGLKDSTFTNSTGLPDPNMRVTARDLALLARYIIREHPDLFKIYSEREFTWNNIRQQNRNPLFATDIGADGLKTGFTREAGYSLVGSAVQNGQRLIVVTLGLRTAPDRAAEAVKLLSWGFRAFERVLVYEPDERIAEVRVFGGTQSLLKLTVDKPFAVLLARGSKEKLTARLVYDNPIRAPVQKGAVLGRVQVLREGAVIREAPVVAAESVEVGSVPKRAFDAALDFVLGFM